MTLLPSATAVAVVLALAAASPVRAQDDGLSCHRGPDFLVVAKERAGEVGTDFLVRPRRPGDDKGCRFEPDASDYRVGGPDEPLSFTALEGRFLILDSATGPSSSLVIYDLSKRAKLLDVPVGDDVRTDPDGVSYWEGTGAGTRANCRDYARHEKDGFGSRIETRSRFSFASGTTSRSAQTRCRPVQ